MPSTDSQVPRSSEAVELPGGSGAPRAAPPITSTMRSQATASKYVCPSALPRHLAKRTQASPLGLLVHALGRDLALNSRASRDSEGAEPSLHDVAGEGRVASPKNGRRGRPSGTISKPTAPLRRLDAPPPAASTARCIAKHRSRFDVRTSPVSRSHRYFGVVQRRPSRRAPCLDALAVSFHCRPPGP